MILAPLPVCIVIVHTDCMNEQPNIPNRFSKLKNMALGGAVALALHQAADAQNPP